METAARADAESRQLRPKDSHSRKAMETSFPIGLAHEAHDESERQSQPKGNGDSQSLDHCEDDFVSPKDSHSRKAMETKS